MLEELVVTNLGVVASATVRFTSGLNVITGETGAGKTLLVEALGLLLGQRAGPGLAGPFSDEARVDGCFQPSPQARRLLEEAGLDDGDELVMSRRVPGHGASRGWVNGRPVTAALLGELGDTLVAVHGQQAHRRLLTPAAARDAVDARCWPESRAYREAWAAWRETVTSLEARGGSPAERAREADLLRYQVGEVAAARLEEGEDDRLGELVERLSHAQALREAGLAARQALEGVAAEAVGEAVGVLRASPGGLLTPAAQAASELQDRLAELSRDLREQAEGFEDDPEALEAALVRQAVLGELRRKYGETVAEVVAYGEEARKRLDELEAYDERARELSAAEEAARQRREAAGAELSAARHQAAAVLTGEVTSRLPELALRDARVAIEVEAAEAGPTGADRVAFLFSANPGLPPAPVQKVASGGELSRLMLALELALADPDTPSLVFDEVDAGVGGAAGAAVGAMLAELAARAQVFCVTHLAQVAAHATTHVAVRKEEGRAQVDVLDEAGRVAELSRMLAGQESSKSARAHAEELLAQAQEHRPPTGRGS